MSEVMMRPSRGPAVKEPWVPKTRDGREMPPVEEMIGMLSERLTRVESDLRDPTSNMRRIYVRMDRWDGMLLDTHRRLAALEAKVAEMEPVLSDVITVAVAAHRSPIEKFRSWLREWWRGEDA